METVTLSNRQVVERFFDDVLGQGRMEVFEDLVAQDYVFQASHIPVRMDRDGHRAFIQQLRTAFPDLTETVTGMIVEGDQVVTRLVTTGTHRAEFSGVPATGRSIRIESVNIDRVEDGLIRERWLIADGLTLLQQIGAIPAMG